MVGKHNIEFFKVPDEKGQLNVNSGIGAGLGFTAWAFFLKYGKEIIDEMAPVDQSGNVLSLLILLTIVGAVLGTYAGDFYQKNDAEQSKGFN